MDTVKTLTDKVNQKLQGKPLFFIANDPERALGLEKLIENFHIICIDDNDIVEYMKKDGVNIFSLEKELGELNAIYRNSNRLMQHEATLNYINKFMTESAYAMFFKIAPNLEFSCNKHGCKILNTSSELNRRFELKLSQYEILKNLDVHLPDTIITKLADITYEDLVKKVKEGFVVQFNRGHTGGGTVFIDSKATFEEVKALFPKREVRVARFIQGDAYTLNACITRKGICWGGLSYQITGVEELTAKRAGTVGNDWKYAGSLDDIVKKEIDREVKIIGERMAKDGFLGMFGIDLVIHEKLGAPYIIEINARQPASIPMFTKLQLLADQIPLNLLAIAEFLNIDYEIDVEEYNKLASSVFDAAQVFIRNKFDNNVKVLGSMKPGVYRMVGDNSAYKWEEGKPKLRENVIFLTEDKDMPLVFQNEAYAIDGIEKAGMLLYCVKEGKEVSSNAEVARIQIKQTLLDKNKTLKFWVNQLVKGLQTNIALREIPS